MSSIISVAYSIIKAVPAARDMFFELQDLYYADLFKKIEDPEKDFIRKRRALSNSIENANSNEDLRGLSSMLAELERSAGMSERQDRTDSGKTSTSTSSPE